MTGDHSHRASVLTPEEVEDIYSIPNFSDADREIHFALNEKEADLVQSRRGAVGLFLILMIGYFKAKRQFFDLSSDAASDDMQFVRTRYFPELKGRLATIPSRPTLMTLQNHVLELYGFRRWHPTLSSAALESLALSAARSTQPRYLARELLQHFERHSIVTPPYSGLQDLIGEAVSRERNRLTALLKTSLTRFIKKELESLLQADGSMYKISVLKKELNDFSYTALRDEVARRRSFEPLHAFAQRFLSSARISQESSKYYASLVTYYTVYKLARMDRLVAFLYLLCFSYHRYRQINDHLVEAFLVRVDGYTRQAGEASKEAMQQALIAGTENLKAAGEILNLFVDKTLPDSATFAAVKAKAFTYLAPERIPAVADYMRNVAFDKAAYQWQFYTSMSMTIKKNLRHLFVELEFTGRVINSPLQQAIEFLQRHLRAGRSPRQIDPKTFPLKVIPGRLRKYLFSKEPNQKRKLDVDRYEFLVYRLLSEAIEAGNIYVHESNDHKRFEDDLISDERWRHKDVILRELNAPMLRTPIQITLANLAKEVEEKYKTVNERIAQRANAHINVRGKLEKRKWSLVYPSAEETDEHPFYAHLPTIGISDLLWFVAGRTGFLKCFTHVIERFVKRSVDPREVFACATALGTNMGILKMAEVSGISYSSLLNTSRSYLRSETIRAANDCIANATAQLSAFSLFNIRNELHSSSDGQRFETQVNTVKARHSPKYFGLKKGVSVCTIVANHIPINGTVIGAHEHESHYVFDLLFNNTSDIRPERHSTDTHGTNQVNFVTLHCYGHRFAPRYKDVQSKTESLVGFRPLHQYADLLIKPSHRVNEELIVSEWPNIQRILASLGQKEVTQSTIIRKLSSYQRQNRTRKALWELDSIYRTLYLLDFIDDVQLRQSVQKALNRGEAYHRFRRAIAYINSGKFRVQTEEQQRLWNDCSRLIANAIIYYNTVLLSKIYDRKLEANALDEIAVLKSISPVGWRHTNLFGNLEFSESDRVIDLDSIAIGFDLSRIGEALVVSEGTGFD